MNRDQAEQVFGLIDDLHGELRERLITSRWWLIWAIMGVQALATCVAAHVLLTRWPEARWLNDALWGTHVILTIIIIRLVHRRVGGQRTARERVLWGIWVSFIGAAAALSMVGQVLGLPAARLIPFAGILAAFAFAMTAVIVHRAFWGGVIICLGVTFMTAVMPGWEFLIWGSAWFVALESLAIAFRPRQPVEGRAL